MILRRERIEFLSTNASKQSERGVSLALDNHLRQNSTYSMPDWEYANSEEKEMELQRDGVVNATSLHWRQMPQSRRGAVLGLGVTGRYSSSSVGRQ
jgi:hypothetical protein